MNKKFSTLVAALMAAGALVMPAEMFAQLRYANGATYENVKTSTKLPNANKTSTYFWVLQDEEGKDYVAIVENNTLIAKPFLAATMNDVIKVTTNTKATSFETPGSGSYTIFTTTGDNLGLNSNNNAWDQFGSEHTSIDAVQLTSGALGIKIGTAAIQLKEGAKFVWENNGTTKTFTAKSVAAGENGALEEIPNVHKEATTVTFGSEAYLIMAAGKVLAGNEDGTAEFVDYSTDQANYWIPVIVSTGTNQGYALLKNKETEEYLTIGGVNAAVKLTWDATNKVFNFADGLEAFGLVSATDQTTPLSVSIEGVPMYSFALGQGEINAVSASDLRSIFGASFNAEIKKGTKALKNNPFTGELKPVTLRHNGSVYTDDVEPVTSGVQFMIQNGNGKIVAMQINDKYANNESNTYGYKLVELTPRELALTLNGDNKEDKYAVWFSFYASEDFVAGEEEAIDYITVTDNTNTYRLGSLDVNSDATLSAENGISRIYLDAITIKLGKFNTVDVKKLLASPAFYTVTNKNTKESYSRLHYGKVAGLNADGDAAMVKADEALVGYPETQWAITYDEATKDLTFTNREQPAQYFKINATELYKISGKENIFAYVPSSTSFLNSNDTIEIKANTQYKEDDGYLNLNANTLKNRLYNLGVYSTVWNGTAYTVENHKDKHQIGLNTEQESATKWNVTPAWFYDKNSLGETIASHPDTIMIGATMSYWSASDNAFVTTDKDVDGDDVKEQTVFLKILSYSFQNESNDEYMEYNGIEKRYVANPDERDYFALKKVGNDQYQLVTVNHNPSEDPENGSSLANEKVYGGNSANGGLLNKDGMYKQVENDLFVLTEAEAPEYLKLSQGDTIRIFRDEFDSNVLYEKGEFADINNAVEFSKINPALYVDTAYMNRDEAINRYDYLLAVNVNRVDTTYKCNVPAHGIHRMDTTYGRFLVNLADSAIVEDTRDIHVNKYVYDNGTRYARLGFVEGMHTNDTLVIASSGDSIAVGTPEYNLVKFAFRVVDHATESFVIETGYKYPEGESELLEQPGYLRWINGNLVVTSNIDDAEIFRLNADETRTPTANEAINAEGAISVTAIDGAVVIKGAEGKNVVIATILGKVVANETVSSNNETIAVPAGIAVVSVDGESFKVVVK